MNKKVNWKFINLRECAGVSATLYRGSDGTYGVHNLKDNTFQVYPHRSVAVAARENIRSESYKY